MLELLDLRGDRLAAVQVLEHFHEQRRRLRGARCVVREGRPKEVVSRQCHGIASSGAARMLAPCQRSRLNWRRIPANAAKIRYHGEISSALRTQIGPKTGLSGVPVRSELSKRRCEV